MYEIKFASLLQLQDEHLLQILKQVPNEVLLAAVAGERQRPIRQRVCEVLTISGAMIFLNDFSKQPELTDEETSASQAAIVKVLYAHVTSGRIELSKQNASRKLAS